MSIEAWALFCLTEFVMCLNPGPSAPVVISQSLTRGPAAGVRVMLGVTGANAIYFGASASGLIALHALSAEAFSIMKWCGSAYLAYLGVKLIRSSLTPSVLEKTIATPSGSPFLRGFVTQGANPNLLVYFTVILPQFIDPAQAVAPQIAILACSSFVIESAVLSAYAGLSGRAGGAAAPRFRTLLESVGGGLLIGAAAGVGRREWTRSKRSGRSSRPTPALGSLREFTWRASSVSQWWCSGDSRSPKLERVRSTANIRLIGLRRRTRCCSSGPENGASQSAWA